MEELTEILNLINNVKAEINDKEILEAIYESKINY